MYALVKPLTVILGIALLAAGVLGFVMNPVFVFTVNTVHNVVHLASGALALIAVGAGAARLYLIVFGLVYAAVTIAGFIKLQRVVDLLHLNTADNFLHLVIAAACLVVGFGAKRA